MTAQRSEPTTTGPNTPVWTLMTRAVARIAPEARIEEVAQKMTAVGAGALGVGTAEAVVAIVSERDVTRSVGRADTATATAAAVGSADLVWCRPDTTAAEAAQLMCDRRVRHLLVGDETGNELEGIVSARDLIEVLIPT